MAEKVIESLKPCTCGFPYPPSIGYIAGCTKQIALAIKNPYGGAPMYYISCACGRKITERVHKGTRKEADKIREKLIKRWNRGD